MAKHYGFVLISTLDFKDRLVEQNSQINKFINKVGKVRPSVNSDKEAYVCYYISEQDLRKLETALKLLENEVHEFLVFDVKECPPNNGSFNLSDIIKDELPM